MRCGIDTDWAKAKATPTRPFFTCFSVFFRLNHTRYRVHRDRLRFSDPTTGLQTPAQLFRSFYSVS